MALIRLAQNAEPATPPSGKIYAWFDTTDQILKYKTDDGVVHELPPSGAVATDVIWDAKGDLAVATGSNTAVRLPVGSNGQILTADSAETTGVKWAAAPSTGDVVGPASATDNAIARFDTTTGKLLQNSGASVDDSGNITGNNLSGTNTGDQTITLTGDVTGSGTGSFAATIANDAVTYAKIQNVSATDKILGRQTSGAGDVEEIACTAAGRALIDDLDASAQRTTLGLGTLATQNGTFSGTSSGTNTGDQTITLTGDVTGSGTGSFSATIANDAVTYAKIQNVSATDKLLGRSSSGSGDVEEITCTAAGRAILDDATASDQRTTLGLAIGTDVQAYDAELAAIAGLTSAADKLPYFTGSGTAGLTDITSAGRAILDDATAAAQRTTLGVGTIGTLASLDGGIHINLNGGGSAIATGSQVLFWAPYSMTVTGWQIGSTVSGSIVIDVWKSSYAGFPPVLGGSIAGTEKPTLSSTTKNQDLSLSSWSTTITKGDCLIFNVDSASTVTNVALVIFATRVS